MKTVQIVMTGILLGLGLVVLSSCSPKPPVTILWEDDGNGFIQFQTNDPANENQAFMKLYPETEQVPSMTNPVIVNIKKVSGTAGYGFGIIFGATNEQNYYRLLINIGGEYRIAKVVAGGTTNLAEWTTSPLLNIGWNSVNEIKVAESAGRFYIFFNGSSATDFTVDPMLPGGQAGFIAYVGSKSIDEEYFPAGVVDVRFQMTSPANIP